MNMLAPTGIITPVRVNKLILRECTAGEFDWNEGGVVQLPAPYITLCDFLGTFSGNFDETGSKIDNFILG